MNLPQAALGLIVLLQLACEQWHLSINRDGLVFVSVIGDVGEPRHRFRLRARDAEGTIRTMDLPASGELTLTPVADGELQLSLLVPEGCRVAGPNPQSLTVSGGQERISFEVRCS
jgi:hypothetical protein